MEQKKVDHIEEAERELRSLESLSAEEFAHIGKAQALLVIAHALVALVEEVRASRIDCLPLNLIERVEEIPY